MTELDDLVHQRVRLGVLAIAAETPRVEFTYLREALQLTAGNLSRHLTALVEAGLVRRDRATDGVGGGTDPGAGRPRTWLRITPAGREALRREVAALRALLRQLEDRPDAGVDAQVLVTAPGVLADRAHSAPRSSSSSTAARA